MKLRSYELQTRSAYPSSPERELDHTKSFEQNGTRGNENANKIRGLTRASARVISPRLCAGEQRVTDTDVLLNNFLLYKLLTLPD
jgi:hypothetical protein